MGISSTGEFCCFSCQFNSSNCDNIGQECRILEIIIKPLLRYQDAIFPIFGGFLRWSSKWGGQVSGKTR